MCVKKCLRGLVLSLVVSTAITTAALGTGAPPAASTAPHSFADLVQPLLPAVVNISTSTLIGNKGEQSSSPLDSPFPKGFPLDDLLKDLIESMPRNATSLGSGFIIDPEGYIVTNNHLVADADQVTVTMNDNTELKATLVGRGQYG